MNMLDSLSKRIDHARQQALFRQRHVLNKVEPLAVRLGQKSAAVFCSNDYLGLSVHPQLINAMKEGVERYGVGGSSSQLVCGHLAVHRQAEEAFADFFNRDKAILFSNGFMANQGVLSTLAQKGDRIVADKLVHASIIDASMLTPAKFLRYRHLDYDHLVMLMQRGGADHRLLVTDSVFSQTGEIADLKRCAKIADQFDATLMVDDAHGVGVLGTTGAGASEAFNLTQAQIPVLVSPLAKAFGVMGAVVAGHDTLIEGLVQFARSYIYTNAIPPAFAYASLVALQIVKHETWRREKLEYNIKQFKTKARQLNLPLLPSNTPIQVIQVGEAQRALQIASRLLDFGFLLNAIRPPTVVQGQSCLRVTLSALHSESQLSALLYQVKEIDYALSSCNW